MLLSISFPAGYRDESVAGLVTSSVLDGRRPVREIETRVVGDAVERLYTWGLDLAGWRDRRSLEESGGIGGLLAVRERVNGGAWATYYVFSDPQGNVIALATADGTLVAQCDYDPYGCLIRETGLKVASCPFRYSTEYRDPDLELYYGYRWYNGAPLKWLTPTPSASVVAPKPSLACPTA